MHLLPEPQSLSLSAGHTCPYPQQLAVHPDLLNHLPIRYRAGLMGWALEPSSELPPFTVSSLSGPAKSLEVPEHDQGYALAIQPDGITIQASTAQGVHYGMITLEQIVEQHTGTLPALEITDWPAVALRYHHDDISRKQVSKLEDFKRILHHLARFKINAYTLYMEDMLHLPQHPQIGEGRGKLMPEDVREIVAEAEKLGIEVFPTISLIGHQENLLALPRYAHLATDTIPCPATLDPTKPETRDLVLDIIETACDCFPSRYFHMCFDETHGVDRAAFLAHANWCAEQLTARGKQPVMWIDRLYAKKGYGMELLEELHPAIIPVVWTYSFDPLETRVGDLMDQAATQRPSWGLTGYNNWLRFIPDNADSFATMRHWVKILKANGSQGLGSSLWGDQGYENHRDLPWHLFAAFADTAWTGETANSDSLPSRFQQLFYGTAIPELLPLIDATDYPFEVDGKTYWELHRHRHVSIQRLLSQEPELADQARRDLITTQNFLDALEPARARCQREASHLLHWESALRRTRMVIRRILFAADTAPTAGQPLAANERAFCEQLIQDFRETRAIYARSWLHNNRLENISVSLKVFDERIKEYEKLLQAPATTPSQRYLPLDLSPWFNNPWRLDMAFTPVGLAELEEAPFHFADLKHTHFQMAARQSVELEFDLTRVRDIHLIASAPIPEDRKSVPALRIELLRNGEIVFSEDLRAISHITDSHDVYRRINHWGGGGYSLADPIRLTVADTNHKTSLLHLQRFTFTGDIEADGIRLTDLGNLEKPARISALTLEKPSLP